MGVGFKGLRSFQAGYVSVEGAYDFFREGFMVFCFKGFIKSF